MIHIQANLQKFKSKSFQYEKLILKIKFQCENTLKKEYRYNLHIKIGYKHCLIVGLAAFFLIRLKLKSKGKQFVFKILQASIVVILYCHLFEY